MVELTAAGPVLVHFFDFAQLNSLRALPYVIEWDRRYREAGLTTLGVHSPRFAFTKREELLAPALERLGITHPVVDDSGYVVWHDYGCEGWPSLFLWGQGAPLIWFHFGEGEYAATEARDRHGARPDQPAVRGPGPGRAAAPQRRAGCRRRPTDRRGLPRRLGHRALALRRRRASSSTTRPGASTPRSTSTAGRAAWSRSTASRRARSTSPRRGSSTSPSIPRTSSIRCASRRAPAWTSTRSASRPASRRARPASLWRTMRRSPSRTKPKRS